MTPSSHFASLINKRLKALGLSKADLARRMGVTPEYVRSTLSKPGNMAIATMERFADAVDCDLEVKVRLKEKKI